MRARDFHTAIYVGVDDDARYLVNTDNLCPDCTTPMIVLIGEDGDGDAISWLHTYHDIDCVVARNGAGPAVSGLDVGKVADVRTRYRADALEMWSDLA